MNTPNDGGPAFPINVPVEIIAQTPTDLVQDLYFKTQGMSLRDYFAAAALQGLIAAPTTQGNGEAFAHIAYGFADAMLAQRDKT